MASGDVKIISPMELYLGIEKYFDSISSSIVLLLEEARKQRNCNEKGIFFRKILLLFDNYFKNSQV